VGQRPFVCVHKRQKREGWDCRFLHPGVDLELISEQLRNLEQIIGEGGVGYCDRFCYNFAKLFESDFCMPNWLAYRDALIYVPNNFTGARSRFSLWMRITLSIKNPYLLIASRSTSMSISTLHPCRSFTSGGRVHINHSISRCQAQCLKFEKSASTGAELQREAKYYKSDGVCD
jgi:hypothetical protein